jgi:hypothetical protein
MVSTTGSAVESPSLARVTLRRTDPRDVAQRQIYARIDGLPTHTLLFGDTVQITVPAGQHALRANNTLFWKSVAFSIAPGQHIEFLLINRASRVGFGVLALLGVAPLMLSIEQRVQTATGVDGD